MSIDTDWNDTDYRKPVRGYLQGEGSTPEEVERYRANFCRELVGLECSQKPVRAYLQGEPNQNVSLARERMFSHN